MKKLIFILSLFILSFSIYSFKSYLTVESLYVPTSYEDAVNHWNNPEPNYIVNNTDESQFMFGFNFRPCPIGAVDENGRPAKKCSCCCGICFYITPPVDPNNGEGNVLIKNIGNNQLKITYIDRLNYNQNMQTLIGDEVFLDNDACIKLGINSNNIKLTSGYYTVNESQISKFGEFIVNYEAN